MGQSIDEGRLTAQPLNQSYLICEMLSPSSPLSGHRRDRDMTKPPRSKKTVGYSIRSYRLAGLVIGGMIADASDGAVAALRHWLKII
ncbi:hypothetical protein [Rhizobium ruizarguesonis]|uniref:hypothetical protein n=1 Tax=Rhizobium ruizarguesonis TaxID=2081791 RepID=UPI0013EE8696|nr:hypothetical protein [Rhizobium ruizarguesonis]